MYIISSFQQYACRKTLADRRIRIRGRFAKNQEQEQQEEDQSYTNFDNPTSQEDNHFLPFDNAFNKVINLFDSLISDIYIVRIYLTYTPGEIFNFFSFTTNYLEYSIIIILYNLSNFILKMKTKIVKPIDLVHRLENTYS